MADKKSKKEGLLPCPFCGAEAEVSVISKNLRIVGCFAISMICPNPTMSVYPDENGQYDYEFWNTRVEPLR